MHALFQSHISCHADTCNSSKSLQSKEMSSSTLESMNSVVMMCLVRENVSVSVLVTSFFTGNWAGVSTVLSACPSHSRVDFSHVHCE